MNNVLNISAKLVNHYGNLNSGIMAQTLPKPDAKVGDEATILRGRDRDPARIVEIVLAKNGKVKAYVLQAFQWVIDNKTEGYAKEIRWDHPEGSPSTHEVIVRGNRKGTVRDALIGHASAYYDRSF
jgi:hypothetical protein